MSDHYILTGRRMTGGLERALRDLAADRIAVQAIAEAASNVDSPLFALYRAIYVELGLLGMDRDTEIRELEELFREFPDIDDTGTSESGDEEAQ